MSPRCGNDVKGRRHEGGGPVFAWDATPSSSNVCCANHFAEGVHSSQQEICWFADDALLVEADKSII